MFGVAKYMMNFPIAPVMGGIVMNQTTWQSIPENYRAVILKHAAVAEQEINLRLDDLRKSAVDMMIKNGLVIYDLTEDEQKLWTKDADEAIPRLVGSMFDADTYRQISGLLQEYRSRK
jgi:TRAP-type C4-dicarboxylate transport system substrate-binding protein